MKQSVRAGEGVEVSVDVTNTGGRDGNEVVELYVSRTGVPGAPIRSLARFERISLAAGQTRTIPFTLDARAMSTVDGDGVRRVRQGRVDLWIGGGQPVSRDGLEPAAGTAAGFEVSGSALPQDRVTPTAVSHEPR